jgi:ATP diphosphatase
LVRRHPHVFGDGAADTPEAVAQRWDELKAEERAGEGSALDGVPAALPSLARAQSLVARAARQGFVWPDRRAVLAKLTEEVSELEAADEAAAAEELGDVLFVVADYARHRGIAAEDALREACDKFERRFRALEARLRAEGRLMAEQPLEALLRLWAMLKNDSP